MGLKAGIIGLGLLLGGTGLVEAQGSVPQGPAQHGPVHAVAMHGTPKYGPGFTHFDYTNPAAPKGGEVRLSAIGSYDSLNPFILRGTPAAGAGLLFDTLTVSSSDEAFSRYGLLAETMEIPDDRGAVTFTLRPQARFHDGSPVTAEDVHFSFETLRSQGHPRFRAYYADVEKVEILGPLKVKFIFKPGVNRELPLIVGELPIFSKAYYSKVPFDKTTLEAPLGSGPYRLDKTDPGRSVSYKLDTNYWGRDLPVNKGRYNFASLRYEYYRDSTVALEAFKAGDYDFRLENSALMWSTAYEFPAVKDGHVVKAQIRNELPSGMQGFAFNQRKSLFQDPKVRQALGYMFDFEWSNKTLFYGLYTRSAAYWGNSELAARGLPSGTELELLKELAAKFPDSVPATLFTAEYNPPVTDGSGNLRDNIRSALRLLREAGWEVKDTKLTEVKTGRVMAFEVLLNSPLFERITLPYKQNLERIGVTLSVRTVEPAQYQKRVESFDFDMIVDVFGASLSPGNELRDSLSSARADIEGSENVYGLKNPAVDALIDQVIAAPDRDSLIIRTRALDRLLQWSHLMVPHWHSRSYNTVYWNKFDQPATPPKYGLGMFDTWWIDPERHAKLPRQRAQ